MRELALHLLDIAENSIAAQAQNIIITIDENTTADFLRMTVADDGTGMDAEMVDRVTDPFVTTRTTRKVGLGIPLLKEAAEACRGYLRIESTPGKGTVLVVEFQLSHIDRMPLGDIASTMLALIVGSPTVHWVLHYKVNEHEFVFDDASLKNEIPDIPLSEPTILSFLRSILEDGIQSVHPTG